MDELSNDDFIIPFPKWRRNYYPGSERNAWRLIKSGGGPRVIKFSERCYGVRLGDHRAWLATLTSANGASA